MFLLALDARHGERMIDDLIGGTRLGLDDERLEAREELALDERLELPARVCAIRDRYLLRLACSHARLEVDAFLLRRYLHARACQVERQRLRYAFNYASNALFKKKLFID